MTSATEEQAQFGGSIVSASADYDYIRFCVADTHGISRGKSIPRQHIKRIIEQGGQTMYCGFYSFGIRTEIDLDSQYVKNYCQPLGNCYMLPADPQIYPIPWAGGDGVKLGEVICETFWEDGKPQEECPRILARRQIYRLEELGFSILVGSEMEFPVYEKSDVSKPLFAGQDAYCHLRLAKIERLLYKMDSQLRSSSIDLEAFHIEYGPGQIECVTSPTKGIAGPDACFRLKEAIKEIFRLEGYTATFMAKPSSTSITSGAHFNHSLWNISDGSNAMYDPSNEDNLSSIAKSWIAGLIKHGRAITALCCPTVNCYRRLGDLVCPVRANWGIEARETSFRAKNQSAQATYVENRLPSSAANPYLVMAATVAAGLDGIKNKLTCPPESQETAELLPRNLEEAICALEEDEVIREALGENFIECYTQVKRGFETKLFSSHNMKENKLDEFEAEGQKYFEFA